MLLEGKPSIALGVTLRCTLLIHHTYIALAAVSMIEAGLSPECTLFLVVLVSYFLFYTAYDKKSRSLDPSLLIDVIFVQGDGGLSHTLKEYNKALSLAGLTVLLISFTKIDGYDHIELFRIALLGLSVHSIYSFYEFYGFSIHAVFSDKLLKPTSIVLAMLCLSLLFSVFFGATIPWTVLAFEATTLGLMHFWMYEIDYKYELQIRPYAYLPFFIGLYVCCVHFLSSFNLEFLLDLD